MRANAPPTGLVIDAWQEETGTCEFQRRTDLFVLTTVLGSFTLVN
jgi:hypothetical protein